MLTEPTPDELVHWHKFFAIECNNEAWQLAENIGAHERNRELLDLAHASVYHWGKVGTELNRIRGYELLAFVHAICGHPSTALEYISEVHQYFISNTTEEWEYALVHMIRSHAAFAAGDSELHRESYSTAESIVNSMPPGEDKDVIMKMWTAIPRPS